MRWMRSVLIFLLGAVAIGVVILLLQVDNNILVVEIHWKHGISQDSEYDSIIIDTMENITRFRRRASHLHTKSQLLDRKLKLTQADFGSNCSNKICVDRLTANDMEYYKKCMQKADSLYDKFGPIHNGNCHFMNGTSRYPIALASVPGSGSTWLRGMLEKLTGICTGAIYCDCALRTRGFNGEGIRGPSVLAIKTHNHNPMFITKRLPRRVLSSMPIYGGAVLLVRNPRDALIAEWHRERSNRLSNGTNTNHVLHVGKEYFGNNKFWNDFVHEKCEKWKTHVSNWIVASRQNPFLVIRYEDLKPRYALELKKVLKFFGIDYTTKDIMEKLGGGFNNFYRNHSDNFTHYTVQQEKLIKRTINETLTTLSEHGISDTFGIREYLYSPFT